MLKSEEIRRQAAQRLKELFPTAKSWEESAGARIGRQTAELIVKFKLGEWKVVNAPGQTVRDAIVPMIHQGASPVLFQLLGFLNQAGREVASIKDALQGETSAATMQPTTLLALIEQGLKVFAAIYKRIHDSAKEEFAKLYALNRKYMNMQERYQVGEEWKTVSKEDYAKGAGVRPVSDPAMVSDMQKAARAQFLQAYQNDPLCDNVEIRKQVFDAMGIEGADKLIHGQSPPNPALLAKTAEMQLEGHKVEAEIASRKASQVRDLSQAVLNLANADKVVGDTHLAWIEQHIDVIRLQLESLTQPAQKLGEPGQGQQQPPAAPPEGIPHPATQAADLRNRLPGGLLGLPQPNPDMSFHNAPFAQPGAP